MSFRQLNDTAWGTDDALSWILTAIEAGTIPSEAEELNLEVETVIETGAWNNRNRARLRLKYHTDLTNDIARDTELPFMARLRLQQISADATARDQLILRNLAVGHDYAEIAAMTGLTVGSLRTRVSRIRTNFRRGE